MSRLPSTADVRPMDDVIQDCRKLLIGKLPGNRMVAATWGAFCEASEIYRFAQGVIDENPWQDHFRWTHMGQHYAAARMIRKIADALGVPTMVPESEWTGPEVED